MTMQATSHGMTAATPRNSLHAVLQQAGVDAIDAALYREWEARDFAAPSPHFVKQTVLLRNGLERATWVETGTYLGATTSVLATIGRMVYSIEPEPTLFAKAEQRFQRTVNVKLLNGTSEDVFPSLLPLLEGPVCFWLDGHYSAGNTFKGPKDTPIVDELTQIEAHLPRFGATVVMVDDIRCFDPANPEFASYPSVDYLIDWARRLGLDWHIEHDIFIARKR
jgi:hypothetical protein